MNELRVYCFAVTSIGLNGEISIRMQRRVHLAVAVAIMLAGLLSNIAMAETPAITERDVSFRNGAVELKGTFVLPESDKPPPAVVFLHGSGPQTRDGFRPYAERFARLGVASLLFDKRGTGTSSGSWVTSSLDDLVDDALAAIRFLQDEGSVDPSRIGFWGISQAGWVAPRAAAKTDAVAFLVIVSGGGASPRESEMHSYRQAFDHAGLTEAQANEGFALLNRYFAYLGGGEGRVELAARLEELEADEGNPLSPLGKQLNRILPSPENQPNWNWVANYDPMPDIEKVQCPVLLMFGDRDLEQPTRLATQRWKEGLRTAGNDDVTLLLFPGAGHGIRMGAHGMGRDRPPFADGYWEVMIGWLWLHVLHDMAS